MKQIVLSLIVAWAIVSSAPCAMPEADVTQVVETFYKQYYRDFVNREVKGDYDTKLIKWVKDSPYTSPKFKKALAKALSDARKKDPELGLGSDPILAAQDSPDKGYRAQTIKISNNKAAVIMESLDHSKHFHISLELVNINGQWLIDRIGNIPAGR